jgi:hypothetical protein
MGLLIEGRTLKVREAEISIVTSSTRIHLAIALLATYSLSLRTERTDSAVRDYTCSYLYICT